MKNKFKHRADDNTDLSPFFVTDKRVHLHTAVCVDLGLQGVPALPAAISLTNIIPAGVVGNPTKNGFLNIYSVNNVFTPCP